MNSEKLIFSLYSVSDAESNDIKILNPWLTAIYNYPVDFEMEST